MFLYLPKTGIRINASLIAQVEEVDATVPNPSTKSGTQVVRGVNLTMHGAPLITEEIDDENEESIPFYQTFTGDDAEVILGWVDSARITMQVVEEEEQPVNV